MGLRRKIIRLGCGASYLQAWAMELMPGKKMMTRDNFYTMLTDNVCEAGFPSALGVKPATVESVVPVYLASVTPRGRFTNYRSRARR